MRNRSVRTVLLLVPLLAFGAVACGDDHPASGPGDDGTLPGVDQTPEGDWRLAAGPVELIEGHDITMSIEGDQIGGRAACNQYGGTVDWDEDGSFGVGDLAQTEMYCEPAAVMELEQAFLGSVGSVDTFAIEGEQLVLRGAGDTWTFELLPPVPTAELTGTTWRLDGYVSGDAVSNEIGMDAATLVLHSDGTVTGSTNCRELSGTWIESGAEVLLNELAATGVCADEAATDLDGRILEVLGDGFTASIDGQRLTLTAPGSVGLTYIADPAE